MALALAALRQFAISVGVLAFVVSFNRVPVSEAKTTDSSLTLSIDCGATEGHTDTTTNITWTPDTGYITTGRTSTNVTLPESHTNSLQYRSLRFFPGNQTKFCYELPATPNTTYLVRASFLDGNYDGERARKPSFRVHVDTTNAGLVRVGNSSDWEAVVEVVVVAVGGTIDLCLAPSLPGIDVPFVNFIEVRRLNANMYPKTREGYVMVTGFRYGFGGAQEIRYPSDQYDRIWAPYLAPSNVSPISLSSPRTRNVTVATPYTRDNAPVAVLNTALAFPRNTTFTLAFNLPGGRDYVVLLWFADIDPALQRDPTLTREFMVGIDGNWQAPIDVAEVTGGKHFEAYEWGYGSVALRDGSYLGFQATERSDLGPIVNALEVYGLSDPVRPGTDLRDGAAINAIKSERVWPQLATWAGDPCLFISYDWTSCSVVTTPRVTELELAGYNLTGSIPAAVIQNLTELTVLSLGNNSLTGSVPDLSALKNLQQLRLENNNFTGAFPAWVVNLTSLKVLSVQGNNLTGYVPQSLLNNTNLTFTYTANGLCTGASPTAPCNALPAPALLGSSKSNNTRTAIIIGSAAGALGIIILIICFLWLCHCKPRLPSSISRRRLLKSDPESAFASSSKCQMMAYSFNEVRDATNNFRTLISEGGFGPVFKGTLLDGREFAAKRCRPFNRLKFTEFFDEVEVLARVHHKNLTSLIGFCQDDNEQILLYEYLSNSDLRTHLHGDGKHLPWSTRLAIALDIAQGIQYLHTSCYPSITHRDVKPSNILLTKKMVAKVADFGIAKFTSEQDLKLQVYSADVKGAAGYLDPEYAVSGRLTDKSDVYGFGVVLLELVSGQEPISKPTSGRNPLLIEWMRDRLASEDMKAVVDPRLGETYNLDCMWRVAELGMTCVEPRAFNRPTMTEVVEELQDAIALEDTARGRSSPVSAPSSSPV